MYSHLLPAPLCPGRIGNKWSAPGQYAAWWSEPKRAGCTLEALAHPAPPPEGTIAGPPGYRAAEGKQPLAGLSSHETSLHCSLPLPSFPEGPLSPFFLCPPQERACSGLVPKTDTKERQDAQEVRNQGSKERRTLAGDSVHFSPAHSMPPLLLALVLSARWVQRGEWPEPRGADHHQ